MPHDSGIFLIFSEVYLEFRMRTRQEIEEEKIKMKKLTVEMINYYPNLHQYQQEVCLFYCVILLSDIKTLVSILTFSYHTIPYCSVNMP